MLILYEVSLYPNESVHAQVRAWLVMKKAYWQGETSERLIAVRYSYRKEPKRFKVQMH